LFIKRNKMNKMSYAAISTKKTRSASIEVDPSEYWIDLIIVTIMLMTNRRESMA
jgi:hypothetical protein